MSAYQTVAVPFVQVGNRRGLTDQQLCELPWVEEFFLMFRHCFERHPYSCVWLFIESA